MAPFAGWRLEAHDFGEFELALLGSVDDGLSQRMFAGLFDRSRQPQQIIFRVTSHGRNRRDGRLALSQRASFVDNQHINLFQTLQGFGIANENTCFCPAPPTHHD